MLKIRVTGLPEELGDFVKRLELSGIGDFTYISNSYKQNRKNSLSKYESIYIDFLLRKKEPCNNFEKITQSVGALADFLAGRVNCKNNCPAYDMCSGSCCEYLLKDWLLKGSDNIE